MPARTIRTGIGSYRDANGLDRFGFLGETVEVHDDDLERFDRLNPEPAESEPAESEPAEVPGEAADGSDIQAPGREDGISLADLDLNGLRSLAADRGVDIGGATTKKAIIAAILATD